MSENSEGEETGQSLHLPPYQKERLTEASLSPNELATTIIETLRTEIYKPSVDLYNTFSAQIKTIPQMAEFAQEMEDASVDTNADLELMTQIAELGLKGQSIKVVNRSENTEGEPVDRSFLYLGPRTNQDDVDPSTIRTIEKVTPEELNGLLLRTVENRTRNAMSMVQIYPEIVLMSLPGHPKAGEVNDFINRAKDITGAALQLERSGYQALKGDQVKVTTNQAGNRVLAVRPKP